MRIKMPAVRIAQADSDGTEGPPLPQDVLTCGSCQKPFALSDIVRFIQHKIVQCNKEHLTCYSSQNQDGHEDDGNTPLSVNCRKPSISDPISGKKGTRIHTPPPASPRPADLCVDGAASSTPKRSSSPLGSSLEEDVKRIKQEMSDSSGSTEEGPNSSKRMKTEVADAESNTTHSEPSNYTCSTCKARLHSAWRLVQHVQHSHGVKIYVESSPKGNSSSSSSCSGSSTSSGCSSSGPAPMRHHLLPPPDLQNPFGVGGLLRLPLPGNLPPLNHPVPPAPLFARPDHFRMEQLVSEQFRHHGLNLAAAAAAVAAGNAGNPHGNFPSPVERLPGLSSQNQPSRPNSSNLLEPQLDFYSQRLRALAGTTSPGGVTANSPSPRKLSPPYLQISPSNTPQHQNPNPNTTPTPNQNTPTTTTPITNNNNNNLSSTSTSSTSEPAHLSPHHPKNDSGTQDNPITTTPTSANTPPSKPDSPKNSAAEAVHTCEVCNKKFRYQSSLETHMRSHNGEKMFKCTVCNHSTSNSSKHKRHMRLHKTPDDQNSNAGSVETLDGEESEEEDLVEEEEEEDEEEEIAEDLSLPPQNNKNPTQPSLVGELMDKFGLSSIATYSEAYKQAIQESTSALNLQKDRDNNNKVLPAAAPPLRIREEFAKNVFPLQPPQPMPLFGNFDPFETSKRLKLDLGREDWWQLGMKLDQKITPPGPSILPGPLMKKESKRNDTCEFCGKVFKNCSNLTVHRRSHTGEKPYKCELCSYACAQSSKLTRHMKTHGRLGKDVYRCRFCEMPFSVPSTLEKHMRKCVVNQGKAHFLPQLNNMQMISVEEDSSASKEAT